MITPPVGTSLFVGCRIANISMTELIPPMLPLLAIMIGVLLFVTYVPESFMWLPRWFDHLLGDVVPACYRRRVSKRLRAMPTATRFTIEIEREADGRWLAEIPIARAKALALQVLAERLEHGEATGELEAFCSRPRESAGLRPGPGACSPRSCGWAGA